MSRLTDRILLISRSLYFLRTNYHKRILRLISHLVPGFNSKYRLKSQGPVFWLGDFFFYLLDLLLVPEIYECILFITRPQTRLLNKSELAIAHKYFGSSINPLMVKVNSQMRKSIEKYAYAYVTINTINFLNTISIPILVHELVHVWQYQNYGSMYIFRALHAQRTKEGYEYGGLEGLYHAMTSQKRLTEFNFEQQAAIVEDYCRLITDSNLSGSPIVLATYQYFVYQLQD